MEITYDPKYKGKERVRLAEVPMPASPDLREGERNVVHLSLVYYKNGMLGGGRGYYLTIMGCSTDGTWESHALMQDPSFYILVENTKRFSAKKMAYMVEHVPVALREAIDEHVARCVTYYESKGEAA